MNFRKDSKGITLIALVITIIVLLILAAVSLNLVAGGDGILGKAGKAVDNTNIAKIEEEIELAMAELKTDYYEEKYVNRNNQIPSTFGAYAAEILKNSVETANGTITLDTEDGETITYAGKTGDSAEGKFDTATGSITDIKTPTEENSDDSGESGETGGTTVTIPEGLTVGAEVSYTPSGTYNEWTTEHSGYDTSYKLASGSSYNAEDATLTNMTISSWKVFKIDEDTGEVQLVPASPTTATVGLKGANGYNNAVKLLNDACDSLYGNGSTIKARSINIEDIEDVLDYDPTTYVNNELNVNYDQQQEAHYTTNKTYPAIYSEEIDSVITPTPEGKNKTLGLSDYVSDWVSGSVTTATSIRPYQTYYSVSNLSSKLNESYLEVLISNGSTTTYWVASRCINLKEGGCNFCVHNVNSGNLTGNGIAYSSGGGGEGDCPLFPVITLSAELIQVNTTSGWTIK